MDEAESGEIEDGVMPDHETIISQNTDPGDL